MKVIITSVQNESHHNIRTVYMFYFFEGSNDAWNVNQDDRTYIKSLLM